MKAPWRWRTTMSQQNDRYYEIAHIEARLAGEEGADHPRQRLCTFLEQEGYRDRIARANEFYEFRRRDGRSRGEDLIPEVVDFAFFDPHSRRADPGLWALIERAVEYALASVRQSRKLERVAALQRAADLLDAERITSTYQRLEWSAEELKKFERRNDRLDALKYAVGRPGAGSQAGDSAPRIGPATIT